MRGYKAFYRYEGNKLRCRDKVYEVGQIYTESLAIPCAVGMHFCSLLVDTLIYYDAAHAVICEVEAPDNLVRYDAESYISKCCTTELRIIREVPIYECCEIAKEEIYDNYIDAKSIGVNSHRAIKTNGFRKQAFEELTREAQFRIDNAFFLNEIASGTKD